MSYYLFLDDVRYPSDVTWVNIPKYPWITVRNYAQFCECIEKSGIPEFICYDHDLGASHYGHGLNDDEIPYDQYTEKTGYHCAKWLVNYCSNLGIRHPKYIVHSLNPVGKSNIINYIENYNKIFKIMDL